MKFNTLLILPLFVASLEAAFFTEDFETDGQDVGTGLTASGDQARYNASTPFNDSPSDHWNRTDGSDISNTTGAYSFFNGTFFWAAEDTNDNGGNGEDEQTLDITGIDITGKTGLQFQALFGVGNGGGVGASSYDSTDYIKVQAQIDGGGYIDVIWFSYLEVVGDLYNEPLGVDSDFDGAADSAEDLLGTLLKSYSADISGTGSTLDIRILVRMDSTREEIAFDNIQILGNEAPDSDESAVEFTYFGTNNDSFEPFLGTSLPISITGDAIPQADQGSNLYQNGTIEVAQFVDQDLSGLSTFGRFKVTVTQTTQLAGYILKARYFKQDANNSAGFSASGPVLQIDGDELVSADVTAEAETGGRVSEQTGFQLRAWKEAKTTVGDGEDSGGTDGVDSGDSSTSSVMNPSGLAQTGANLLLTVEADLDHGTWESFYTPDGGVKTLVGSGTGVTEIDNFYFNIKSDPNDLWGDSLLIPPGETPSAGDNITVGYILLGETKSWGIEPVLAIGFNDDSGTSMFDAAVLLDTAQDSRFNYKSVYIHPVGLISPTSNGWDYGGPVTHNGSLNLGYTKYFRWTNSQNGGLADVTKRYGLDSSTPSSYELEVDGNIIIYSGIGQNIPFPSSGKISLEVFISSYDLSRSWDDTREDDSVSLPGKGIQFGLANGYEAGTPQTQKAYIDLLTLENVTDDISIPEGSIGFTYIGTHNDSFENFVTIPTITTTSDIPLHPNNSNPNLSETFTVAEFADQDLSSFSQFGRTKVTIPQTSELAGHNLKVRFYRQNSASADNWTPSGPTLSIDGDTLASEEVTAQAESGIGVNNQTGFLVKVWKEAKETETEPLVIPDGHIAFTFIGTNNHDFSAFVTVPTTLDAATIPAQPQGSSLFAEGNLLVAGWTGDPIGGASFGRGKVIIPQTSLLENYDLKVRFFKADASNESGFSAAGTVITINGDTLSAGEVTAEAQSGMGVSEQTGFQVKIWKESRIDTDFDDDGVDDSIDAFPTDPNETVDADGNGIGDNADAAAAVVIPALNISIVGTNAELSWDDTQPFDLHHSSDLSAWTNTNINSSPHSRVLSTTEFFKLIESAPEPAPTPAPEP